MPLSYLADFFTLIFDNSGLLTNAFLAVQMRSDPENGINNSSDPYVCMGGVKLQNVQISFLTFIHFFINLGNYFQLISCNGRVFMPIVVFETYETKG